MDDEGRGERERVSLGSGMGGERVGDRLLPRTVSPGVVGMGERGEEGAKAGEGGPYLEVCVMVDAVLAFVL